MKYDHLRYLYWFRFFLTSGIVTAQVLSPYLYLKQTHGFGPAFYKKWILFIEQNQNQNLVIKDLTFHSRSYENLWRFKVNYFLNFFLSLNYSLPLHILKLRAKLVLIKTFKGIRYLMGFPTRGQSARSNAKNPKKFKFKNIFFLKKDATTLLTLYLKQPTKKKLNTARIDKLQRLLHETRKNSKIQNLRNWF